ncbi:tetratricopeptide repeat protein [Saprospira grandis]|uniref:TPR repeat-containing protein n=1 Tax=Saprospira grandis (strain Lewin) TaxID=984262 RepID=H6L8C5_SAPGL|nr:tetratricopeptide repeat protein [Saprospira grandis]AFC26489.1 TPR repeat-containing protein [Saprospira grandis str. Lewin]
MTKVELIAALEEAQSKADFYQLDSLIEEAKTEYGEEAFCFYYQAEYYRLLKDQEQAIDFYQKAIAISPQANYRLALALSLLQKGEAKEALALLQALQKEIPEEKDLQYALALYYSSQGEEEKSLLQLNKLLAQAPDDVLALRLKVDSLEQLGQYEEALQSLQFLKGEELGAILLAQQEIALLKKLERSEDAIKAYRDLIASDPKNIEYRLALGDYYMQLANYEEAQYCFADVLDLEKKQGGQTAYTLKKKGRALLYRNQLKEAQADFKAAMKTEGDDSESYLLLAQTAERLGQLPMAKMYLELGLDMAAYNRWPLYQKLGQIALALEEWTEAEKAFEGMTREAAGKAEGFYQLGLLYIRQGDLANAYEMLLEADEEFHEKAMDMLKLHCADFLAKKAKEEEGEMLDEFAAAMAENAQSPFIQQVDAKLWTVHRKATIAQNPLLKELPKEMQSLLLKAFEGMLLQLTPKGLFLLNLGQKPTRAIYRILKEASSGVAIELQPLDSGKMSQNMQFRLRKAFFVLCGIGEGDAKLDIYFQEQSPKDLPAAIKAAYKKAHQAEELAFLK